MKLIRNIIFLAFGSYCFIFGLVAISESWFTTKLINPLSPSESIHTIWGLSKETILLSPNLEQAYRTSNFISPVRGYALRIEPSQAPFIVNTNKDIPLTIKKFGSTYSYFYFELKSALPRFKFGDQSIKVSQFLDAHDHFVHSDGSFTFIEYVPNDRKKTIDLQIKRINPNGLTTWSWNSDKYISKEYFVQQPIPSWNPQEKYPMKERLIRFRRLYSGYVIGLIGTEQFQYLKKVYLPIGVRSVRLFDAEASYLDVVHANSFQYLNNESHILVSARNLDAVFIIDVKTGSIIWKLGGPYSLFTKNRPVGDPHVGFSHQHDANVFNNKLYLFDNANMFPGRPARVVVYSFDFNNPNNSKFIFEYLEPYGKRRLSMGSVQPLDDNRILIGWGGVPLGRDRLERSAGASIVNMRNKKVEWQLDFQPGWTSYDVRGYQ